MHEKVLERKVWLMVLVPRSISQSEVLLPLTTLGSITYRTMQTGNLLLELIRWVRHAVSVLSKEDRIVRTTHG
jgi:hypothetical protein